MSDTVLSILYLLASILFILSLNGLSSPKTAFKGNNFGIMGMVIALAATIFSGNVMSFDTIIGGILIGGVIGSFIAAKIPMTALPQLVAGFHSLVGLAAICIAAAILDAPDAFDVAGMEGLSTAALVEMGLGSVVGAITFTGSLVAFGKLQGLIASRTFFGKLKHFLNVSVACVVLIFLYIFVYGGEFSSFVLLVLVSCVLGVTLILPVGGADMPVIVSMLNSYSGWAACGIGFTLGNHLLLITGGLVGASGAILSYVMCKGMNRSLRHVIFGGISSSGSNSSSVSNSATARQGSAEDAAFIMQNARSVIIVPGYGMAVAQAQHVLQEISLVLKSRNASVRYAIHPVAGRMPGHMNVLLAEANVPYEDVCELDEINHDFGSTDVVIVIGANDVTNPSAKTDTQSPIYGMPILDVEKASTVLFIKRSLSPGYAGVDNPLFYRENTMMLFGDAKAMCEKILRAL